MVVRLTLRDGHGPSWPSVLARLGLAAWIAWLSAASTSGEEPGRREAPPTFAGDVAAILQGRCQSCHRPGQVGPFPLQTYEQARKRSADIAAVVEGRRMPPWMPAHGVGVAFKDDQSLSQREIDTLVAWAVAGAPEGDPARVPPPPQFPEGWKLGPPDLVLEPGEDYTIPASGSDVYRCFVIPSKLDRDIFVSAIDFRPTNRRVVHHITAFIVPRGAVKKLDDADPGPGYSSFAGPGIAAFEVLGFWNAGHEPSHLPAGIGIPLPKNTDMIVQIHYHPSGKPEVDRTQLGLYYSRGPVKQALHWNTVQEFGFELPAGESDIPINASWYVPADLELLAVSPHMHLLGRSMNMSVTHPDGRTQDLISVPDWDPSWQSAYYLEEPLTLRMGSIVKVAAVFDNSAHPRNPNQPPKLVKWGHGVHDEMCDGFIAVVKKGQDLTRSRSRDDLPDIFSKQRIRNLRRESARRNR